MRRQMGKLSEIRGKLFGRKRPPLVSERIPSAAYEDLPPAIAAKLKASANRVKRIVLLRGIFATIRHKNELRWSQLTILVRFNQ